MNKIKKVKNGSKAFTSGEGRVSYPSVVNFKYDEMAGEDVYEVTLLFPKDGNGVDTVREAIAEAESTTEFDTTNPDWKNPIIDGDSKADSHPEMAGNWCVKFKSKTKLKDGTPLPKPEVLSVIRDINKKFVPITDPALVYGGCYGRVSFKAVCYNKSKQVQGTSLVLLKFQKTRDGEPFGGVSAESAFADSDQFVDTTSDLHEAEGDAL